MKHIIFLIFLILSLNAQAVPADPALTHSKPMSQENILRPTGLGEIKLGMKWKKDNIVDRLINFSTDPASEEEYCLSGKLVTDPMGTKAEFILSKKLGIIFIGSEGNVRTPAGIGIGSAIPDLQKAYPDIADINSEAFAPTVNVSGNRKASYEFVIDNNNKIGKINLIFDEQDCFN